MVIENFYYPPLQFVNWMNKFLGHTNYITSCLIDMISDMSQGSRVIIHNHNKNHNVYLSHLWRDILCSFPSPSTAEILEWRTKMLVSLVFALTKRLSEYVSNCIKFSEFSESVDVTLIISVRPSVCGSVCHKGNTQK